MKFVKHTQWSPVGLANTTISTDYAQKSPQSLLGNTRILSDYAQNSPQTLVQSADFFFKISDPELWSTLDTTVVHQLPMHCFPFPAPKAGIRLSIFVVCTLYIHNTICIIHTTDFRSWNKGHFTHEPRAVTMKL